jgi:hypothetical protein
MAPKRSNDAPGTATVGSSGAEPERPDRNMIEIYFDRSRSEGPRNPHATLVMIDDPLYLDDLLASDDTM